MDPDCWSDETKAAYLACAIDTDGWIGLRMTRRGDGSTRLTANVGITNQSRDFLERIAHLADVPLNISMNGKPGVDSRKIVTRSVCWQSYWRSPPHILKILVPAEPYLVAKRERALWAIEFCESRLNESGLVGRKSNPYTARSWELARLVTEANGRSHRIPETPEGLL